MTTKKTTRSPRPSRGPRKTKPPLSGRTASNVVHLHEHLAATRVLGDAQRVRHDYMHQLARAIGTKVSKADFDVMLRTELDWALT